MLRKTLLMGVILSLVLVGCNFDTEEATPTVENLTEEPVVLLPENTLTPSPTPSPSPSPTAVEAVALVTPSPTPSPEPSLTPLPSATFGPWEYEIKAGDTLGFIIRQPPFNYRDTSVINEIVRINPNIPNADSLPGAGSLILIPRPTSTAIPQGVEQTAIVAATQGIDPNVGLPVNTNVDCHPVEANETIISIASRYNTTLEIMSRLNRDLDFGLCNFDLPSGGPNCNVFLSIDQCVNVPLPTPTPTLSPTPSGSETPTRTPTYAAPRMVFPPDGSNVPPVAITLQWVSVGVLGTDQYYLVEVIDQTAGTDPWREITRSTSVQLPETLIPSDGQPHQIVWTVRVAERNEQGLFAAVGGTGISRAFQWQSR
jgi:hypothetical protein